MSKSVKKILTVAAAIAVAYFAPTVAATLLKGATFTSAATATAASVISTAAVNAAGNAAIAAATGGDVGKAAIAGAISGGVGGYLQGPVGTYPGATPAAAAATGPASGTLGAPAAGAAAPAAAGVTAPAAGATTTGTATLPEVLVTSARGAPVNAGIGQTIGSAIAAGTPGLQTAQTTTPAPTEPATAQVTEAPSMWDRVKNSNFGKAVTERLSSEKMADLTLRAAGQIAGSYITGSGLSPEEESLLAAQRAELEQLRSTNLSLFNQRLQAAQDLIGGAKYFDPEYFGLQSARRARLAGVQAEREGTRGLMGERLAAEQRRYRLGTARNVGTAYDVGYGQGVQGRLNTLGTGLQFMPTSAPSMGAEAMNLQNMYSSAGRRRTEALEGTGDLFGSITGRQQAGLTGLGTRSTRPSNPEEEEKG